MTKADYLWKVLPLHNNEDDPSSVTGWGIFGYDPAGMNYLDDGDMYQVNEAELSWKTAYELAHAHNNAIWHLKDSKEVT